MGNTAVILLTMYPFQVYKLSVMLLVKFIFVISFTNKRQLFPPFININDLYMICYHQTCLRGVTGGIRKSTQAKKRTQIFNNTVLSPLRYIINSGFIVSNLRLFLPLTNC